MGRGQGCCKPITVPSTAPMTRNYLVQDVNSAKSEKSLPKKHLFLLLYEQALGEGFPNGGN